MPKERTRTHQSRTKTALVAGGISLLFALAVAWPVYVEIATRSAFLAGTLHTTSATSYWTTVAGGPPVSSQNQTSEFAVMLPDGTRYRALTKEKALIGLRDGELVQAGMLGDELVSVNGHDVRGVFPFGYFALLMVLTGTTVLTVIMVIKRRSMVPDEQPPLTVFHAWPAAWLFLPVALVFDVYFDSPWWPVIGWGGSCALLLSIYTVKYVRKNRMYRAELATAR